MNEENMKYIELNRYQKMDIKFILETTSKDDARPILSYVFCEGDKLVTSDGYRLSIIANDIGLEPGLWRFPKAAKVQDIIKVEKIEGENFPDYKRVISMGENLDNTEFFSLDPALLFGILKHTKTMISIVPHKGYGPIEITGTLKSGSEFYSLIMPKMNDDKPYLNELGKDE